MALPQMRKIRKSANKKRSVQSCPFVCLPWQQKLDLELTASTAGVVQVGELLASAGSTVPCFPQALGHLSGRGSAHEGFSKVCSSRLPPVVVPAAGRHGLSGT